MTDRLEQKIKAIRLYSLKSNAADVQRQLQEEYGDNCIDRKTIVRVNKQFDETGSVQQKHSPGRPRTSRTSSNKEIIRQQINNNAKQSTRRLSMVSGISRTTVRRLLKDLKVRPYIPRLRISLSEDDFDRRMETCNNLLSLMDGDQTFQDKIFWSDEAKFTLAGHVNRHNCVMWASENPNFTIEHDFRAPGLMVWAAISSQGIVGPVFIDENVNADVYLALLQEHVFPLAGNGNWYMHDGAPAHYAVRVREFLDQHFTDTWIGRRGSIEWAPRSPDLTPADFFLWGFLKDRVYSRQPKTLAQLRTFIQEETAAITIETCQTVCRSVQSRCRECINNEGKQFEHLL